MTITNPQLSLRDVMRAADVPLDGRSGMLTNSFDPVTGALRPEAAAALEGYVVKTIAGFFGDQDAADEPLSERIRMMAGAIGDAAADLRRIATALEQLAEDVADAEEAAEETDAEA